MPRYIGLRLYETALTLPEHPPPCNWEAPIAILLGQGILEAMFGHLVPWFDWKVLPTKLPWLAATVALGEPLHSPAPIATALLFSGMSALLPNRRFEREEF